MTMHSHRRIELTGAVVLTLRRSGRTTVGPETTRMAPRRIDIDMESPSRMTDATDASPQVSRAPIVTRFLTTDPIARSSENLRLKPPSKRMIATAIETVGKRMSPSRLSGSMKPVTGPATMPTSRRRRIDGRCRRHASHWAPIPRMMMAASPMR
jgi:hypothetical protein